jgi:DNA-binding protein HU-beta
MNKKSTKPQTTDIKINSDKQAVTAPVNSTADLATTTIITKKDLIRLIAVETVSTPKAVQATVNAMLDIMSINLAHGAKIAIIGFGTFVARTRKSRAGINPKTKEKIMIDESISVGFRAGTILKKHVSKK